MPVLKFSEHTVTSHMVPLLLNLKDTAESTTLKTNFDFDTSDHRALFHFTPELRKLAQKEATFLILFLFLSSVFFFFCISLSLSGFNLYLWTVFANNGFQNWSRTPAGIFTVESSLFWKITAIQSWFAALFCTMQPFLWALYAYIWTLRTEDNKVVEIALFVPDCIIYLHTQQRTSPLYLKCFHLCYLLLLCPRFALFYLIFRSTSNSERLQYQGTFYYFF